MKVGGGGLQAQTAQEGFRTLDADRLRPTAGEALQRNEDLAMQRLLNQLNRAVEQMQRLAEMYNQPLLFSVKKRDKEKPKIKVRDRRTGAEREMTLKEATAWLTELAETGGKKLNGYV